HRKFPLGHSAFSLGGDHATSANKSKLSSSSERRARSQWSSTSRSVRSRPDKARCFIGTWLWWRLDQIAVHSRRQDNVFSSHPPAQLEAPRASLERSYSAPLDVMVKHKDTKAQ